MLLQNIVFWKQDPNASFEDLGFNLKTGNIENVYLRDIEMVLQRDYILIQLQFDIIKDQTHRTEDGWLDITINDLSNIINLGTKLATKHFMGPEMKNKSLKYLGSFQMIVTGTKKDYWTKSEIDIHKFKIDAASSGQRPFKLGDLESESNLEILNRELFNSKYIRGDILGNLKLNTTIYGLGNDSSEDLQQIPNTYLLNLEIDPQFSNNKDPSSGQNKHYRLTINTVISNFGSLFVYLVKLNELYKEDHNSIQSKSNDIRDKALKLQIKINNLLTKRSDISTSKSGTSGRSDTGISQSQGHSQDDSIPAFGWEEKLLLRASRNFSILTELNQVLAKANYQRHEATMNIEKMTLTMGLTQIKYLGGSDKEIASLGLELKQFSKSINYYFQNLKLELDHSQTTIKNTVDIIKTFLESEQRIVSQKSSEAINWIVIVFAGLGLSDALGNFVIFWLEGGNAFQAMVWFFIILVTLIMIIVTLYMWYFKRPRLMIKTG